MCGRVVIVAHPHGDGRQRMYTVLCMDDGCASKRRGGWTTEKSTFASVRIGFRADQYSVYVCVCVFVNDGGGDGGI